MGVIKKFNPETGQWEIFGSTEASDINIMDVNDNFSDKNVEAALRELSTKLNETMADVTAQKGAIVKHSSDIAWLKEYGGGGGSGAAAPTITSTFESCSIDKETELEIPIFFSSPNLGEGTAYVIINNIEVASIPGIKQGNNTIEIGKLTEQVNQISIYVKDRANMLSNQLTWTVKIGGIDLIMDFDDTADYYVGELITMQYNVASTSTEQLKMYMTIDYDDYEINCKSGYNEYTFPQLGVGIHNISLYITDGVYSTAVRKFNIVIVNSVSLYISSIFEEGSEHVLGIPIQVQYRISKASNEYFDVKLYLNNKEFKSLSCTPGTYYWTLNDLDVGDHNIKIEVSGAYDDTQTLEFNFKVVSSGYEPIRVTEDGLIYRLNAKTRTNQDNDREFPIDDSGRGVTAQLHNFNWFSNGWIDGELVCDGEAYVEIDLYPYKDNALYGSTIEICYTSLDIGKTDARILDYTDIEAPYKGVYVDIQEAAMNSLANSGLINADREVETTISFVIDRKNKFGKIFIDGICSRAFSLSDSGSGVNATREDFTHVQKIFLNSKKGESCFGACKIKDFRVYNRVLSDDEIVTNCIAQISNLKEQEKMYNFNFNNTTLPVIRMYGDMTNMTLETPVSMRIKYTSPNEDKYGQSFDLPYCQVNWQGTSSLQYVLKNFTARLKDESLAVFEYTPYVNGILEDTYCFKADYMESSHSRNVGIAKFVNDCLYDSKTPAQLQNENIRNAINGFPCLMYINDELQGVYNFNLDRYSTKSFGYTDPEKVLVYEISANSDTTAGAFYSWTDASGKDEESYYKSDFECLYPPTRAAGNDSLAELKRLIEWVDKSSDEDFKDNIGRYFNLEYLLRYYLFVLVFGAVDSLGKNAKLASFDGGMTWFFQVYDADTTIGLNNSGFLLFDTDIEMGDENVFNTTGSRLWQRVVLLFQNELKEQYSLMRQGRFTVENIMKYLYDEQISQIPATFYNKDMQKKYLDFGSAYLYALHGNSEKHIKRWIRERLMYVDTLLGYMVSSADYITLRSNKLGHVYLDIEMYIPMYVTVKWRDEAGGTGTQTKRVGKGERVRFEYNMPTETDQEILVYAGHYIKSLGDLSNLQPSTLLIANADRLTEIECHSTHLINTDLSECKLLQKIDISGSTALGTGIGAQPILNVQNAKYLRYLNTRDTQLTAIYTMQSGSNLEEIYYPKTIQTVNLTNQAYLRIVGIPYEEDDYGNGIYCPNLADVTFNNCKNIEYLSYPYREGDYANLDSIKQIQNLTLIDSLDRLDELNFNGFSKLKTLTLSTMHNIKTLKFDDMLNLVDTPSLESIKASDCPLINKVSFNISNGSYKVEFVKDATIDLGGMQSVRTIESNASIKGLKTLIIPLSTKELRFIPGFGDGSNSIRNVWSASANHTTDKFEGMDLQDISLEYLDMSRLTSVMKAINFHIAPTEQHPNMNTMRTGEYFKPEGSIDLTNYYGDMIGMLKGVDLSLLEIKIDKKQTQEDLTGLFEGAILAKNQVNKVNNILDKYVLSTNWSNMFKDADVNFEPTEIRIPDKDSYREMNLSSMFENTKVSKDIIIEDNIVNVSNMFKNCVNMKKYNNNWEYSYSNLTTDDCYKGTGGDLEFVPVPWGGYGFFDDVTTEIVVNVTRPDYTVVVSNRYKTLSFGLVDWGDGTIDSLFDNEYNHTYSEVGTYTIKGHFTFGNGSQCNTSLISTLTEVKRIATGANDLTLAFRYCTQLKKVNISNLSLVGISEAFSGCTKLEEVDCTNVDTSAVTNMGNVFANCESLTDLDISSFDSSQCTIMNNMFGGCKKLVNLNISNLKTDNAIMIMNMFNGCSSLQSLDLTNFNTSLANGMAGMFQGCTSLTELLIPNFNTKNASSLSGMFYDCNVLSEIDLSGFNTEHVLNMSNMFRNCRLISNLNLEKFNTENVTDMSSMFAGCVGLESLDLSMFRTASVQQMGSMFSGCTKLKSINMNNFNTEKVIDMANMFSDCFSLEYLNLDSFNTSSVVSMYSMFYACKNLTTLRLNSFNTSKVTTMRNMFQECEKLMTLDVSSFNTENVEDMANMFQGCLVIETLNLSSFVTPKVRNFSYMFYKCEKLNNLNISNLITDAAENISSMFYRCEKLPMVDVSKFNTSNVTNMSYLFNRCEALKSVDVSGFDTKKVYSMGGMFYNCKSLTELNLDNFDTSLVTDMSYMFNNCTSLARLNVGHFVTDKVTTLQAMFYGCTNIVKLDVSKWNTRNVSNMANLFYSCSSLAELDVSNLNTSNVTTMASMFNGCVYLPSINLEGFDFGKCENVSSMFTGCSCNIKLTNKQTSLITNAFAMFNIFYGTSIDLSGFSLKNSKRNGNFVTIADNLIDFKAPSDITTSIMITAEKLSVESLMSIINNLSTVGSTQVLEIGSKNLEKLTEEQIAVAISKNWSVC